MYIWTENIVWNAWDMWLAVAAAFALAMVYGVWRIWRGMRPDAFESAIRSLVQKPEMRIEFHSQKPAPRAAWFQLSLLPLMLVSCAAALLIAQAQRPDAFSRPVTWALLVTASAWYGSFAWSRHRGVGPLRNLALGGVVAASATSALLWSFYMGVDAIRGDATWQRMTANTSTLLWWVAAGGGAGAMIGGMRAARRYERTVVSKSSTAPPHDAHETDFTMQMPRRNVWRIGWGALSIGCMASLLFHLSAAPQLYRQMKVERIWWHHHQWDQWEQNSLVLTMAPSLRALPSHTRPLPTEIDILVDIVSGSQSRADNADLTEEVQRFSQGYSQAGANRQVATLRNDVAVGDVITPEMIVWSDAQEPIASSPDVITNSDDLFVDEGFLVAIAEVARGEPLQRTYVQHRYFDGAPNVPAGIDSSDIFLGEVESRRSLPNPAPEIDPPSNSNPFANVGQLSEIPNTVAPSGLVTVTLKDGATIVGRTESYADDPLVISINGSERSIPQSSIDNILLSDLSALAVVPALTGRQAAQKRNIVVNGSNAQTDQQMSVPAAGDSPPLPAGIIEPKSPLLPGGPVPLPPAYNGPAIEERLPRPTVPVPAAPFTPGSSAPQSPPMPQPVPQSLDGPITAEPLFEGTAPEPVPLSPPTTPNIAVPVPETSEQPVAPPISPDASGSSGQPVPPAVARPRIKL